MRNDEAGRISTEAIMLLALLLLVMSGSIRYYTNEFLFAAGFFHPSEEQVEAMVKFTRGIPREVSKAQMKGLQTTEMLSCHPASGAWDYVCDDVYVVTENGQRRTIRSRLGAVTHWMSTVKAVDRLPPDGPLPASREENKRRLHDEWVKETLSRAPFDVNELGVAELKAMGVDDKVAYHFIGARRELHRPMRVDELFTLPGIDKAAADKIRPYVRTN